MKLKKSEDVEMGASSGPVIAERFKLDAGDADAKGSGGLGTTIALVCSLLSVGILGFTAWLIYDHWMFIDKV